jgi:hypothetical protein
MLYGGGGWGVPQVDQFSTNNTPWGGGMGLGGGVGWGWGGGVPETGCMRRSGRFSLCGDLLSNRHADILRGRIKRQYHETQTCTAWYNKFSTHLLENFVALPLIA